MDIQITNEQLRTLFTFGKVCFSAECRDNEETFCITVAGWDQTDSLTRECRILALDRKDEPLSTTNCLAIPCIKRIREVTGLCLMEAKYVYDEWRSRNFNGNICLSRMPLGGN